MRSKIPLLFIILILASILRLIYLQDQPPSLNWDEISHGYNAYSILHTGFDEWGRFMPLTNFRAYGDYPLPLNLYLTMPFIIIFGLSEFSIRFPHALLGVGSVFLTFFLTYAITRRKDVSLFSSFLLAISPWAVFTSRFVLQSNLAIFFLIAGITSFFYRNKSRAFIVVSVICLGLTLLSYHSTRIFTPLMVPLIAIVYRKELIAIFIRHRVIRVMSIVLLLIFFAPLPVILSNPEARARSNVVFILNQGAIDSIEQQRSSSKFDPLITRLVYNRVTYFAQIFTLNYIKYFSPQFLFTHGGTQYQFSVPGRGLLYLIEAPFFYIGLLILLKEVLKKNKEYCLALFWLLLAPVPASITSEQYAVVRATTMLPLPQIISSLGFFYCLKYICKYKSIFITFYVATLLIFLENYMTVYFTSYKTNYSWAWQYGYKQLVSYVNDHYREFSKVIVTKKYGEPHEYFLFYGAENKASWKWEPSAYRADPQLIRFMKSNWWWVDRFDKFYFVNDWQIPQTTSDFVLESGDSFSCNNEKCLLITSPGNYPQGWSKMNEIKFLDGRTAFEIYEN